MMDFFKHDHALIRGLLVGAVVLASASACSRSDRTETGSSNTGAMTADTATPGRQSNPVTPATGDTMAAVNADTGSATAPAAPSRTERNTPRAATGTNRDTATAGYSGMERDTSSAETGAPRDTARVTTDSAAAPAEQSSVPPSDSAPMEVATPTTGDTSVSTSEVAVQEDSAAIEADRAVEMAGAAAQDSAADSAAGYSEMASDTSPITDQADTTMAAEEAHVAVEANADSAGSVDAAMASSDTTVEVGDSANVARTGERLEPVVASAEVNDTLTQAEGTPVRPAEDSTEVYGNVTEDRETVAAAEVKTEEPTDAVGAAAIGGNVSGADAVALMTRQGAQCIVVDPESAHGIVMDMSETPATLNPCGMGSMVFTRIWTKKE